ncbi:MAG TPA: lipopolysaccharide assembly protein LapA domain-containing protein [Stellaceae bacterium]|nr:lipopolysaccharide assembly protein LapA domain-containing protein [Stellaceae bacterium]
MKFLWWIVLAVVAVVLILFAISNREHVTLSVWLLPGAAIELPLYLLVLGSLLLGFVAGELTGWIGGWRWRREARRSRERIAMLEREIESERAQRAAGRAPLAAIPP